MRIAIDVREACRTQPTGKGAWTFGCVTELLEQTERTFVLLTDADVPPNWIRENVEVIKLPRGLRWHFSCARWLRKNKPDVFVATTSFIIPALAVSSVPCALVVHDLIAFNREPHQKRARLLEQLFLPRALRKAAHVFCVSNATQADLLKLFPNTDSSRMTCVYAGPSQESPPLNKPDGKTILNVGTLCPRKNQRRLILAYKALSEELKKQYQLVLVGNRGWQDQEIVELAQNTDGVEWRGYIAGDEYNKLLATCTLFVFPSLYEGFGLPVLDAIQRGIPVLTSARGSLIEVAGDAAHVVNPENISAITHELERLLTDEALRRHLREKAPEQAKKYSWNRTSSLVLDALSSLQCK